MGLTIPLFEVLDPSKVQLPFWLKARVSRQSKQEAQLRESIARIGHNVQPIKVRSLYQSCSSEPTYELVFGQKRLSSCQSMGLPVCVIFDELGDQGAFVELIESNSEWSIDELSTLVTAVLYAGLFPSRRRLAEACGLDLGLVAAACSFGELPDVLRDAVAGRSGLARLSRAQAAKLVAAYQRDPGGVLDRASSLAVNHPFKQSDVLKTFCGRQEAA